jgi:ATP-dependent DNA ligase
VLDGEVAICDQRLRSRFDWLREPDPDAVATPPVYMAFDILYRDGRVLTGPPLRQGARTASASAWSAATA